MNSLERSLLRTRKTIRQACRDAGIDYEEAPDIKEVDTCAHCGVWNKLSSLTPDLDDNPICGLCKRFYGD